MMTEETQTKMYNILDKFIMYLYENFDTKQVKPNKVRINRKLRILIRDDGVVFDVNTNNAIGMWNNILQQVDTNNFVLPPIEYIKFDFDYIQNKFMNYGNNEYFSKEDRDYYFMLVDEEFTERFYNTDYEDNLLDILEYWRGADDDNFYDGDENIQDETDSEDEDERNDDAWTDNMIYKFQDNMLQFLNYLVDADGARENYVKTNTQIFINEILDSLNSPVILK